MQNEKDYLGKCYKIKRYYEYTNKSEILFVKVMSAINKSTWYVWTMDFVLPTSVKFQHRIFMDGRPPKFDFCFQDDDIIWFDEHSIHELQDPQQVEEISFEEYNDALTKLYNKITWFSDVMSKEDLTINKIFGEDYEREIKLLSIQQEQEKDKKV